MCAKDQTPYSIDTYSVMFIVALNAIARTQTQPKCPSTCEWRMKMWYMYTMEYYYSAVKKNEIMNFEVKWWNLKRLYWTR